MKKTSEASDQMEAILEVIPDITGAKAHQKWTAIRECINEGKDILWTTLC